MPIPFLKKSLSILLVFCCANSHAQFIQGYGVTIGGTLSNQKWVVFNPSQSIRKNIKPGINGSGFIEYLNHKYYRIVSELQYNMKGSIDKQLDPALRYKANYLCFNNFFKIRQQLYDVTPYAIAGPRLEFLLSSNVISMKKTHLTISGGIGMEFLYAWPWIFFAEIQYNPDATSALKTEQIKIRQNALEIRAGIKYQRKKKSDCPRPKGGKNF